MRTIQSHRAIGFTLLETMIATFLVTTGFIALAHVFWYTARTNITNHQRTTATLLLAEKMEQFRSTSMRQPLWAVGGSINPDVLVDGYFDYRVTDESSIRVAYSAADGVYLRLWEVRGTDPKSVTVVVYAQQTGLSGRRMELARAYSMATFGF